MLHLEGIPISPGYASGVAVVYDYDVARRLELPHRAISLSEVETECERLDDALVNQHIGREFVNVEQALDAVIRNFVERLQKLDN